MPKRFGVVMDRGNIKIIFKWTLLLMNDGNMKWSDSSSNKCELFTSSQYIIDI